MLADPEELVALMPFARQLGVVVVEASAERVVACLDWAPQLCTAAGIMHGGALMSLADTAGALVTFLGLPDGATTATITSTSQLFRPVTSGTVRAVAVPLHRGRTTVTAQTSLFDASDRLAAQTTQVQAVRTATEDEGSSWAGRTWSARRELPRLSLWDRCGAGGGAMGGQADHDARGRAEDSLDRAVVQQHRGAHWLDQGAHGERERSQEEDR